MVTALRPIARRAGRGAPLERDSAHSGLRVAHRREHAAAGDVQDHGGAAGVARRVHPLSQRRGRSRLQARVERQVHIAVARQQRPHRRRISAEAIARERQHLGVVTQCGSRADACSRTGHFDDARVIIEAFQADVAVTLDV